MKYLLLLFCLLAFVPETEIIAANPAPVEQTKVYVIHHERRAFVRRPLRRYLLHRKRVWRRHHKGIRPAPQVRPHHGPRR
ncbi:MAG: hypothetical protein IPP51_09530 [Bacteroidetes bacterium]|nr:hypothetical protein [Bacteroidota bacterium]